MPGAAGAAVLLAVMGGGSGGGGDGGGVNVIVTGWVFATASVGGALTDWLDVAGLVGCTYGVISGQGTGPLRQRVVYRNINGT